MYLLALPELQHPQSGVSHIKTAQGGGARCKIVVDSATVLHYVPMSPILKFTHCFSGLTIHQHQTLIMQTGAKRLDTDLRLTSKSGSFEPVASE